MALLVGSAMGHHAVAFPDRRRRSLHPDAQGKSTGGGGNLSTPANVPPDPPADGPEAAYVNVDPTIVRILFVIAGLASIGFMLIAYLLLTLVVPSDDPQPVQATA
jgi:hypothetical protein